MNGTNDGKGVKIMNIPLTYAREGDYFIPEVTLGEILERPLGKYGLIRKDYLREHRPALWTALSLTGELFPHCRKIEDAVNRRLEEIMPGLTESAGATEDLKARDPLQWAGLMNTCKAQAEEIVLRELAYR